tara:strand:- start:1277 stop:1978 length:702 start_codon:yes stop_codon:yes gene_type:complete
MIFDIYFTIVENVNNDIQLSVAKECIPGQRIVTESLQEKPKDKSGNELFSTHPEHDWLIDSSDNYYPVQGTLKVWFRWKEGDPFQAEHVDDWLAFQENITPNFKEKVNFTQGSDYIQGIYTYAPTETTGFEDPFLKWRPYTSEGGVEIMTHDTVFICPMQYEAGWTFKTADLMNNDSLTVDRESQKCYVIPGQLLHTEDGKRVEKYKLTKLESASVKLINRSGTFCKVGKIFK